MLKTYHGSCHCGAVRFEADIDLAQGTNKCNCSHLHQDAQLERHHQARRVSPDRRAKMRVSDYRFGSKQGAHLFCKTCGVRTFERGHVKEIGGDYVSIKVASLDDVDLSELIEAPVRYANGRDNKWWEPPAETRHL